MDFITIYVEQPLKDMEYEISEKEKVKLLRLLPIEIVVAKKTC